SYQVASSGSGTIALAVHDFPAGVSGSFSHASIAAGENSTLTVAASSSAAAGSATFHVSGTSGAIAHDAAANLTISSATDTQPPVAQVTSPASGATVSGTVAVSASATDNVGVARLEIQADGTPIGS